MATLEVHDGRGRVERVVITRDHPVMFGSSPKADVVLAVEGVLPFHGRVRWDARKKRYKVDASPEAKFLLVNGHKMASSSFRQGDEVEVGGCRIFMIHDGEPEPERAAPRDDVTRVQPPPFLARPAPAPTPAAVAPAAPAAPAPAPAALAREWMRRNLELGQVPADESDEKEQAELLPDLDPKRRPSRGWARVLYLFSSRAYAPGQEEVLSSPLVFGLVVAFLVLVLVGIALYGIIVRTAATRLFNQAVESLEDGDYRNAIRRFDQFLTGNPEDRRAGQARVHRAMANVRQHVAATGAAWSLALEAERAMVDSVGKEPEYRDSATELDELILRTGEGLADRARSTADPKSLAEAESALALHRRVAGPSAEALFKQSRLPAKLDAARAAVVKARVRTQALAAMDEALKKGSSSGAYAARDALVAAYADQAQDRDLLSRMTRANDLIRRAVTVDTSGRPAETEPHPEPFGPPSTLVMRAPDAPAPSAADGPLVFAVADGFAFGLDGATGRPVWQVPVGLASPFPPQPIPGGSTVLAVDARHHELTRLDARTGKLVWRQELGGPVVDPPLVLGNQVIQTTPDGKVLVIDLPSGALRATLNLGMPLARAAVGDESGQALYVVAEKDCLFVLTRDPLGCAAVEYLGHAPGAVACPPSRLGRYLVVAENHQVDVSRWRVFVIGEDVTKLTAVQEVPVLGWTWGTPAASGSVIWASGDRGGVAAYAVGAYGAKDPFRLIARINPDAEPSGPAFALARSERELWVGSGRSGRYELDPEGGKVATSWSLAEAGPALAPPQTAGPLFVLTQQNTQGPGVALWGVEPQTGAVRWRTVLGAAWASPPALASASASASGGESLHALGADGRALVLSREALARGGFVEAPIPRPGAFRLPPEALARVEGDGWTAIVPALGSATMLVRSGSSEFKEVGLPAAVGARPLAWGRELFVPGDDGRAYLIDPTTGESRAEPFVPPFDRTKTTRWRSPVRVGGDAVALADGSGHVRRIVRVNDPRPRLVVAGETSLGKGLAADPASTGGAFVVVTADGRARALSARDFSPAGAWPLDAPLAVPPSVVAGRCFLADTSGGVLCLGEDGQRLWSARLDGKGEAVAAVGPPAVRGQVVWLLARDGTLHARALDDGAPLAAIPLGVLPAGGPIALGNDLAVPVGLGTVRLLTIDAGAK